MVLPGLREIEAGDTQGKRDQVSVQLYIATVHGWSAGDRTTRMPGGAESGDEFFARYDDAVRQVEASGADVAAVVSHGAAIRTWASAVAQNTPDEFGTKRNLENTGIVELEGSTDGGWRLVDWEGEPVGGEQLVDRTAQDPTGERF